MRTYTAVLPLGAVIPARAFGSFAAAAARAVKAFVRARRNRRDALALAGLDRSMLKDIGISRADLNDAFSIAILGGPDRDPQGAGDRAAPWPRPQAQPVDLTGRPVESDNTRPVRAGSAGRLDPLRPQLNEIRLGPLASRSIRRR